MFLAITCESIVGFSYLAEILLRKQAIKRCYIFPPHLINASALPCKTETYRISSLLYRICILQRGKNRRTFGKVKNEKYRWSFLIHSVFVIGKCSRKCSFSKHQFQRKTSKQQHTLLYFNPLLIYASTHHEPRKLSGNAHGKTTLTCLCLTAIHYCEPLLVQGWARDVKARDRDETETLTSRDRDAGFTSRDETETRCQNFETRPRRDDCSSRDVEVQVLIAITGLDVIFYVHCF